MYGRLHCKIWIIAVSVFAIATAQPRMPGQLPTVLPKYAFVSGAASGINKLTTAWPNRRIHWSIQTQAGTMAAGEEVADDLGRLSLKFELPDVRTAVRMAVVLWPDDQDKEAGQVVELVVLPRKPFAGVRQTLEKLGVGLLPFKAMTGVLKRNGLEYTQLQHDTPRASFKGKVVFLGSLLGKSCEATEKWIRSLPAGTCVIVVNDGAAEESGFSLLKYFRAQERAEKSEAFVDKRSRVWTDLPADWLGLATCPSHRLAEPKGLTSLKVLAGHKGEDGAVYPLVMECKDFGGRRWLIWNLPELPDQNDPRWDLLLRNSLLWAHKYVSTSKSQQSSEGT